MRTSYGRAGVEVERHSGECGLQGTQLQVQLPQAVLPAELVCMGEQCGEYVHTRHIIDLLPGVTPAEAVSALMLNCTLRPVVAEMVTQC